MQKLELELEIKQFIIDSLELEDVSVNDIETNGALFGDGLGLDSIDALELGLALKKKYKIILKSSSEESREHFYSVATLAEFVKNHHDDKENL